MKLLTKSEIEQKRAADRKLEIDEGIKLARRVDNLRQTIATEGATYELFGNGNKQVVLEQISELVNERDTLRIEVGDLEVERAKLREPLDAEWDALREAQAALDEQDVDIRYRKRELKEDEAAHAIRRKDIEDAESRIALDRKQTTRNLLDSDALRTELVVKKVEFDAYVQQQISEFEKREAKLASDEENVANRKARNDAREVELDEREAALTERERQVQDMYDTAKRHG